ncbi:MAG TPA: hypothetical protein VNA20_11040 [Frankiaceae bacterium]|nr:hypothetical protein [Frankiaceae bacterium]
MLRTLIAAAVAAASIGFTAPAAVASHLAHCRWSPQPGGSNPSGGVLYGFGEQSSTSSATCYILADGAIVVSQRMEGAFVRPVPTFVASVVRFCISHVGPSGSGTVCVTYANNQIPPQVVWDTLDAVVTEVIWPLMASACSTVGTLADDYGPVTITAGGDVYVNGEPQLDCHPTQGGRATT